MRVRPITELESKIGYSFQDQTLLLQASTHSSFSNEQKVNKAKNYERLEFLGDAVLELTVSEYLFKNHPNMPEGKMTKTRASLVCEQALAYCARDLALGDFLCLGKGEEATGGRNRDSMIADMVEAVIGALYLDGGMEAAKQFIDRFVLSDLENKQLFYDSKTILQEYIQKEQGTLQYELIAETGPEHNKYFEVEVRLNHKKVGCGSGKTKKAAEQQAAYKALLSMKRG